MIGLDTNILVRFLTQDDPDQAPLASAAMAQLTQDRPGLIGREVLIELVWVLERSYKFRRSEIAAVISGLLATSDLVVEGADGVADCLSLYEFEGFGFADLMIRAAARRFGAVGVLTFDRKAAALEGNVMLREDWLSHP
ncbi:MAG: PIN domain-containing protein [Caulobacterales bacterium]